jgi:hypothetical protein
MEFVPNVVEGEQGRKQQTHMARNSRNSSQAPEIYGQRIMNPKPQVRELMTWT